MSVAVETHKSPNLPIPPNGTLLIFSSPSQLGRDRFKLN
jgi:hypothetical protein